MIAPQKITASIRSSDLHRSTASTVDNPKRFNQIETYAQGGSGVARRPQVEAADQRLGHLRVYEHMRILKFAMQHATKPMNQG
jgi:hypothetical protein